MSTSTPVCVVAPRGWDDLADAADFYPADLPVDWRLGYFANAFDAVLLPWADWCVCPPEGFARWRADVGPRFRFFLVHPPSGVDPALIACARAALGNQLAGWVVATDPQTLAGAAAGAPAHCHPLWSPADGHARGCAVVAPASLLADPRAARDWLRGLPDAPRLVILPHPTSAELTAWGHLLDLLRMR